MAPRAPVNPGQGWPDSGAGSTPPGRPAPTGGPGVPTGTNTSNPWGPSTGTGGTNPWNTTGQQTNPGNFGQPMNPWDMPYSGNFTAPMSPWEQNAMGGYGSFVQGGQGLGPASGYLNDVLGGKYLNFSSNPWLQQIQGGLQGQKQYEDADALRRIQSSMAAGGNALSGASAGAQADYLGQSGNRFNTLIGNLMNQNYGMERGFMNNAPGQLGQIAGQQGAGYGQLFNMGGVPRNIQQQDLDRQYQDFLRQTGNMRSDYQYPDTLTQQLLYGGGYRNQTPNQYGNSIMDIIGGMLGGSGGENGIDWSSILGSLFGGGGGGGGGTDVATDGVRLGYDAGTPSGVAGPVGYGDTNWYNQALTSAQAQNAAQQNKITHPPSNTAAGIVGLLLQLMKAYSSSKKKSSSGMKPGAGTAPGDKQTGKPPSGAPGNPYTTPIGPGMEGDPGGYHGADPFSDPQSPYYQDPFLDPNNFAGNPNDSYNDPSSPYYNDPLFDPNNFAGGGGGSSSDFGGLNPNNFGSGDFGGGGSTDFGGLNPDDFSGGSLGDFGDFGG